VVLPAVQSSWAPLLQQQQQLETPQAVIQTSWQLLQVPALQQQVGAVALALALVQL
jgi:hypothetical protein